MESLSHRVAEASAAEAQSTSLNGSDWRPSPAPFSGYEFESNRSTLTPSSYAADPGGRQSSSQHQQLGTQQLGASIESPSYRLDSYYAPAPAHLSSSYTPSLDSPDLPSPSARGGGDVEPAWPRIVPDSPGKSRHTLKKKPPAASPPLEMTEHHTHRWIPFRSKSKSSASREVAFDDRFSSSTADTHKNLPTIQFAEALPPAELGMSPDDIVRRTHAEEAARRLRMQPLERDKPSYKPGAGHSVVGSYVDGTDGRSRPPGWEAPQDDVEQLDDALRMPPPARERVESVNGPQRQVPPPPPSHQRNPSLYSNYSFYTFPDERSAPTTRQPSPNTSPTALKFAPATNPAPPVGTLAKAKAGSNRQGDLPVGEPVEPEDYLRAFFFLPDWRFWVYEC